MEKRPDTRSPDPGGTPLGRDPEDRVRKLYARANRGVWALIAFTALSLWARTGFRLVPDLPPEWRSVFGRPPPPSWISAAFVLYVFSALVLSLTRMATDHAPFSGFQHLGYLAAFYGFYHVSGALDDNYWAVLVGGFAVLILESYRNWLHCRERLRDEPDGSGGRGEDG